MTSKLQLEEVRPDGSPDKRLWLQCRGCEGSVQPFGDEGRRYLFDLLCTRCFRAISKWAVVIGDMRIAPKSLNWRGRKDREWHMIRDNWIREQKRKAQE